MPLKPRVLAIFLVIGCGSGQDAATSEAGANAPAAAAQSGDEQLAELTRYQLTMPKVDAVMQAQRNIAAEMSRMSPAERAEFEERAESNDANSDLNDIARNIESIPAMNRAVRAAGLTAREYALVTVAMMQAGMAASVLQMRPNDNQDSLARAMHVNPANIRFIRENEAELKRRSDAMAAEMR